MLGLVDLLWEVSGLEIDSSGLLKFDYFLELAILNELSLFSSHFV